MCNYTGYHFGASYPDACCIDGLLWDLDSCDEPGGGLSTGGEIPCPECNTEQYLYGNLEDYFGLTSNGHYSWSGAMCWEAKVSYAMSTNKDATIAAIQNNPPIEAEDFACRETKDWGKTIARTYSREESLALTTPTGAD